MSNTTVIVSPINAPPLDFTSTLPYTFTSLTEMERVFSESGIDLRSDDFIGSEYSDLIVSIINSATVRVKTILNKLYDDVDIYENIRVREIATYIACYLLSIRRGNDSLYLGEMLQGMDDLQDMVDGDLFIDAPRKSEISVNILNFTTDNRNPHFPIKVDYLSNLTMQGVSIFDTKWKPFIWLF